MKKNFLIGAVVCVAFATFLNFVEYKTPLTCHHVKESMYRNGTIAKRCVVCGDAVVTCPINR